MNAHPYATLMRFRQWATSDLYAVLARCIEGVPEPDRSIILRVLDHIHAVEEIFRHNLERRPHDFRAPRSTTMPPFDALRSASSAIGAWYVEYAGGLAPELVDEVVDFTYSNGSSARMTRGEMLLHVAMHGTYHRGNVGILLQKNGIQPNQDRLTDFLEARSADNPAQQVPMGSSQAAGPQAVG